MLKAQGEGEGGGDGGAKSTRLTHPLSAERKTLTHYDIPNPVCGEALVKLYTFFPPKVVVWQELVTKALSWLAQGTFY